MEVLSIFPLQTLFWNRAFKRDVPCYLLWRLYQYSENSQTWTLVMSWKSIQILIMCLEFRISIDSKFYMCLEFRISIESSLRSSTVNRVQRNRLELAKQRWLWEKQKGFIPWYHDIMISWYDIWDIILFLLKIYINCRVFLLEKSSFFFWYIFWFHWFQNSTRDPLYLHDHCSLYFPNFIFLPKKVLSYSLLSHTSE